MNRSTIVTQVTVLARRYAPIILALFTFAYVLRGGVLLFGFVNLTLVFLLLGLACVGFLLVFDRSGIEYRFFWADVAVAALALTLLVNSSTGAGIEKALRFIVLVVAPYFIARLVLTDTCRLRRFIYTILLASSLLALLAFASLVAPEYAGGALLREAFGQDRLTFIEANPIQLSMFFMFGALAYIGSMPGLGTRAKLLAGAMFVIMVYMTFHTGSRGPTVAVLAALMSMFSISLIKRSYRHLLPVVFGLFIVGTLSYLVYFSDIESVLGIESWIKLRFQGLLWPMEDSSIHGRLVLFREAIDKFLDNPLRGAGTAGMEVYAHNMVLETAAELGVLGLVPLFLLLFLVLLRLAKRVLASGESALNQDLIAVVALCGILLLTEKQFSSSLPSHKDLFVLFAIIVNFPLLFRRPGQVEDGHPEGLEVSC